MNTIHRVQDYAAILKSCTPDSQAAKRYRHDNAHDLAFLAYASEMERAWRLHEAGKKLQENRSSTP